VHGNNNVLGAEIFPHGIGMGATADASLVSNSEAATARGAKAMGIRWTFAPVLEVSRDARYGRYYESFGEDPVLDSVLGAAAIKGFQGNDPSHPVIAATDKHFAGYSEPIAGHDRTMAQIPLRYLQETFLRPFEAGVDAGVATAMANSASINNIPVPASHYMPTDVLHDQLGINQAVRRILTLKFQLGLFDQKPFPKADPAAADATVLNNPMDVALARRAADESMTLLKNATVKGQPALPLSKSNKIVVSSTAIK